MENREVSEWNGAIDYLNRINTAFMIANDAASRIDPYTWLHQLKIIYREISSVMKEEERIRLYNMGVLLSDKVNAYLMSKNRNKRMPINQHLIQLLEQYEVQLRVIYKESGLQGRLQEDASRALR